MEDKELLEKAAQAASIDCEWSDDAQSMIQAVPWRNFVNYEEWNPLTDDGDALRLAVKLRMDVIHDNSYVMVGDFEICESTYDDDTRAAATRRAITRAAAAMVKE